MERKSAFRVEFVREYYRVYANFQVLFCFSRVSELHNDIYIRFPPTELAHYSHRF